MLGHNAVSVIEEADALYGLPLAEFVPSRTDLAKRLRAEGRREEAGAAAKLPKPTVAAWAANQVLRSQPADARELFSAGDALAGATGPGLRDAIARHRAVLARLMAAARGLLDANGKALSAASLEKVMHTLNAASLDPGLREEARAARLTAEHVYSGLGLRGAEDGPREAPKPKPAKGQKKPAEPAKPKKPKGPDPKKVAAAEARLREAEAALAEAQEEAAAARVALRDLRSA